MKKILLPNGLETLVDDEDFEWLSKYHWCIRKSRSGLIVYRILSRKQGARKISMSREIMNPKPGQVVDHTHHNRLDHQRKNMRNCTTGQNVRNCKKRIDNSTGYKGVDWHPHSNKFRAQIRTGNGRLHLGLFDHARDAALAYDAASKRLFAEFASPNFPDKV